MTVRPIELDAALAKLARILDVDLAEVDFLAHLPAEMLRDLRWEISGHLAAADAKRLEGVMAASALVPASLAATIGERWFGPVLCARLVGLVEPKRAGQYAKHLSVDFMADITARTDPRGVGELVLELDLTTMQQIASRLLERNDHLTLSLFVGHVPSTVVAAILGAIDDNAAVVRIARYVEDLAHLDPVVALLHDDRIVDLVHAVAEADLWIEGLHLFSHLGHTQMTRIATTIVRQDSDAVAAALDGFDRHGLWQQALPLISLLEAPDLAAVTDVLLVLDDRLVHRAVEVVDESSAWGTLVRIAAATETLGEDVRARLRHVVAHLPSPKLERFQEAAADLGQDGLLDRLLAPNEPRP